jgi:type I restriction enzyme S subunit
MVTTGEQRKSADSFQFDDEVVCVPMISSTGHGHASLKRVLYQAGKFALGNLLTALIIKDRTLLLPRFLAAYLNHFKDQLLVPLMTGAANMSFTVHRLSSVPIFFPRVEEQHRILTMLDEADAIWRLRKEAEEASSHLIPGTFKQMFGKLRKNTPKQNASLRDVVSVLGGATPSKGQAEFWGGTIPWVTPKDMKPPIITSATDYVSELALEGSSLKMVPRNCILVVVRGMILARAVPIRENRIPVVVNQDMKALVPSSDLIPVYLRWALQCLGGHPKAAIDGHLKTGQ